MPKRISGLRSKQKKTFEGSKIDISTYIFDDIVSVKFHFMATTLYFALSALIQILVFFHVLKFVKQHYSFFLGKNAKLTF